MKTIFGILFILGLTTAMVACSDDSEDTPFPDEKVVLEVTPDTPLAFDAIGGDKVLEIKTNAKSWLAVSGDDSWCRVVSNENKLTVKAFPNETVENRNTWIRVSATDGKTEVADTIEVKQAGLNKCAISVEPATLNFAATSLGEQISHCSFTLGSAGDKVLLLNAEEAKWLTVKLDKMNKEEGTVDIVVNANPNTSTSLREFDLVIAAGEGEARDTDTLHIAQDGMVPVNLSYTLEPEVFEAEGGTLVLTVKMEPEAGSGFTYKWENGESNWVTIDDSQKDKNILTLETGVYEGEEARTAKLVLETSGAEPCVVEIRQNPKAVVSGDYKLGDIVKNSAGDAVGIVVKEKTAEPGLIMSLKSWRSGSFFTSEIVPELLNSKDGEENTNKILESYTATDCPALYAALEEANNGDSGWFLPSPDNMWDAMTYFTGINYNRAISDDFSADFGTNGTCDEAQYNKVNRLITQAGGDEVHPSAYHLTSMIGVKYGLGKMYAMIWGASQPYGAAWAINAYDKEQLDGSSYVIRLFKKY